MGSVKWKIASYANFVPTSDFEKKANSNQRSSDQIGTSIMVLYNKWEMIWERAGLIETPIFRGFLLNELHETLFDLT